MGIASHLSWANLSYSASYTVSQPNPFFASFALQLLLVLMLEMLEMMMPIPSSSSSCCCLLLLEMMVDGTTVSTIVDNDNSNGATITGTAIIEMQPGQKVSDS